MEIDAGLEPKRTLNNWTEYMQPLFEILLNFNENMMKT